MLLDTGADVSLLPLSSLKSLQIEPLQNESFKLEGFDGTQTFSDVFYLQVIFWEKDLLENIVLSMTRLEF
jgi:hypothetical protein